MARLAVERLPGGRARADPVVHAPPGVCLLDDLALVDAVAESRHADALDRTNRDIDVEEGLGRDPAGAAGDNLEQVDVYVLLAPGAEPVDLDDLFVPTRCANLQPPSSMNPEGAVRVVLRQYLMFDAIRQNQASGAYNWLDADGLAAAMTTLADLGSLMIVHAEDHDALEDCPPGPSYAGFLASRPPAAEEAAIRETVLAQLRKLIDDEPARVAVIEQLAGPETLVHGDLTRENVFFLGDGPGAVRLIDWDHVAVGQFSYGPLDISVTLCPGGAAVNPRIIQR